MGILDTDNKQERLSYIKSLISIASADGDFDDDEKQLIYQLGESSDIGKEEVDNIISNPESIEFVVPEQEDEKLELIYDLVLVMMVDDHMDEGELKLCKKYMVKLGYSDTLVALLITSAIYNVRQGIEKAEAINSFKNVLRSFD